MTDNEHKNKAERSKLEAALASAKASVTILEALLDATPMVEGQGSDLLNVDQTLEQYQIGRDGLLNASRRGEIALVRGARNRIMVERSELERWIKSRPVQPRKAPVEPPAADLDAWDRQAEASLRSVGGGRRR
jgi:hypothetical protein